ncbi:MAG: LysR family transcriptional regulator [Xanthomonadales bacterium]|nr:LysR family transcriptional regulator [Xanthomonadales bacterium]
MSAFRTFLRVAELESFSAAAEQLGIARSLASRRIRDLERALGVALLLRSTRRVRLTEAGNLLRARLLPLLAELDGLIAEASARQGGIEGLLRISCPTSFGIVYLAPALAAFMAQHPALSAELILNDRAVDPVEEGFDLVLSDAERISGQYREEPLAAIELACVAAPAYLASRGAPESPEALRRHAVIHYLHAGTGHDWVFLGPRGRSKVTIRPLATSNNGGVMRALALAGLGVAVLPRFLCREDLRAGALVELLPGYRVPPARLRAVLPSRAPPPKVALLVGFLREHFRARLAEGP